MKRRIENAKFDTILETSDWRYSASIVGLLKYFNYLVAMGEDIESNLYEIDHDAIAYNSEDITEVRYLRFVEHYFDTSMHHRVIEQILNNNEFSDEQIKLVNDKFKANAVIKKVFGGFQFNGENKDVILKAINENRLLLIKETYRTGKSLYANFANPNSLFLENSGICRLNNYYIDTGKKSKSISYNWNYSSYIFDEVIEFDFIPFAFSKSYEAFFINNNFDVKQLYNTNNLISDSDNPRSTIFYDLKNSADYIDYDVEVIVKNRDYDYFETLFIRKSAIKIINQLGNYNSIKINYKVNDNYYIHLEKEVTNCILNDIKLDSFIETMLKSKSDYSYNLNTLIKINTLIYGGDGMNTQMKSAYSSAKKVMEAIPENKVNSYKQKLISAITFNDYERFCEILLQLSSYSGVVFNFAYNLFEDFDENKNLAYTFINALNVESNKDGGNKYE